MILDDAPPDAESGPWGGKPSQTVIGPHLSFRSWWSLDLMASTAINEIRKTLPGRASTGSDNELDGEEKAVSDFDLDAFVNDSITSLTSGLNDWSKVYASAGLAPSIRNSSFYHFRRFSNWLKRLPTQHFPYSERAIIDVSAGLALELNSVKNRLLTLDKDQFDLVDRLEAESEFRFQLLPPLLATVLILALNVSMWWLVALGGVAILFRGAVAQSFRAEDAIADRLFAGDVKAPLLERLERQSSSAIASRQPNCD